MPARPRSVLIVEDFPDAAESLAGLLKLDGHSARFARSRAEALELAREAVPDAALIALELPDGSGYDLAVELTAIADQVGRYSY
jgi:two-component system OmpR family response regulator